MNSSKCEQGASATAGESLGGVLPDLPEAARLRPALTHFLILLHQPAGYWKECEGWLDLNPEDDLVLLIVYPKFAAMEQPNAYLTPTQLVDVNVSGGCRQRVTAGGTGGEDSRFEAACTPLARCCRLALTSRLPPRMR